MRYWLTCFPCEPFAVQGEVNSHFQHLSISNKTAIFKIQN